MPPGLAEALEQEKRRKGKSLNQTVIDLLGQSLGAQGARSNGLGRLAGGWGEDEFRDFERATVQFEEVDELCKAGTPLPADDVWIAATAARNGTAVLTCDDHCERIARVGSVVVSS